MDAPCTKHPSGFDQTTKCVGGKDEYMCRHRTSERNHIQTSLQKIHTPLLFLLVADTQHLKLALESVHQIVAFHLHPRPDGAALLELYMYKLCRQTSTSEIFPGKLSKCLQFFLSFTHNKHLCRCLYVSCNSEQKNVVFCPFLAWYYFVFIIVQVSSGYPVPLYSLLR